MGPTTEAIATIGPAEVRPPKCKTCKERRRIGSVAGKRANASKTFNAVAAIASAAADSGADDDN